MEYELMTFGIPSSGLLSRWQESTLKYNEYLKQQEENEMKHGGDQHSSSSSPAFVQYPAPKDVLIGRGRPYRDFAGNDFWNFIIDQNMDNYHFQATSRFEKTCVTMDVIKNIRISPNRVRYILERVPTKGWKILDDISVREKAAVAFQNRGRRLKDLK